MRAIVFTPDRDSEGKKDYTGAFKPEATRFAKEHAIPSENVRPIDVSKGPILRRKQVLAELGNAEAPLEVVAFFCHGTRGAIQLGFGPVSAETLAKAIAKVSAPDVVVPLYACSTASGGKATTADGPGGDGGFADLLRDALCRAGATGCRVDAHASVGHATMNPNVRRFAGDGSPIGGHGGVWLVGPKSPVWKGWRQALRGDLRFRFPLMGVGEIHEELLG